VLGALVLSAISPFGIVVVAAVLGCLVALDFLRSGRRLPGGTPTALIHSGPLQGGQDIAGAHFLAGTAQSRAFPRLLAVLLGGLPLLFYDLWISHSDPLLAGWNAQNLTPSPPAWDLLLSFSPVLILAFVGAWSGGIRSAGGRIAGVWAVLAFFFLAIPFGLQRRFMVGLYVPLAVLALFALDRIGKKWRVRGTRLIGLVLLLSIPTNLLVLLAGVHGAQTLDQRLYLTAAENQAMDWLEENTPPDALVLAAPETGLFLPAQTGRRVIYGHPFETVNAEWEKASVIAFFETGNEAYLFERDVDYIFYGPREDALGDSLPLRVLETVFDSGDVTIYQVKR
jgi:hypothetical protein